MITHPFSGTQIIIVDGNSPGQILIISPDQQRNNLILPSANQAANCSLYPGGWQPNEVPNWGCQCINLGQANPPQNYYCGMPLFNGPQNLPPTQNLPQMTYVGPNYYPHRPQPANLAPCYPQNQQQICDQIRMNELKKLRQMEVLQFESLMKQQPFKLKFHHDIDTSTSDFNLFIDRNPDYKTLKLKPNKSNDKNNLSVLDELKKVLEKSKDNEASSCDKPCNCKKNSNNENRIFSDNGCQTVALPASPSKSTPEIYVDKKTESEINNRNLELKNNESKNDEDGNRKEEKKSKNKNSNDEDTKRKGKIIKIKKGG